MIMHLLAPSESSINDGIDKEEFPLRYRTIDDAVQMVRRLGSKAELALNLPFTQYRFKSRIEISLASTGTTRSLPPIWTLICPFHIQ